MGLLIVGTVALDTIETPFGVHKDIIGGSATHAAMSASFYTGVKLVSVIGDDFPEEHIKFLKSRKIDTKGIKILSGKRTFKWSGYYEYDMNQAHTRETQLNVLLDFDPELPEEYKYSQTVFLGNIDPVLQLKVIEQLNNPQLIAMDTMNFWIENKRKELLKTISMVDIVIINDAEIRQLMDTPNLVNAAKKVLDLGVKRVVVKKGEHGAVTFDPEMHFAAPSYPLDKVIDPTGAGDSFAGGLMGYLAKTLDYSEINFRKAVILGSVMASYNVEDFSLNRLKKLSKKDIIKRYLEFQEISSFEKLDEVQLEE